MSTSDKPSKVPIGEEPSIPYHIYWGKFAYIESELTVVRNLIANFRRDVGKNQAHAKWITQVEERIIDLQQWIEELNANS